MIEKLWTDWSENELKEFQEVLQSMDMYADLTPVGPEAELPVLTIGLQEIDGEALFANITFTPFEKDNLEFTNFLHIAADFTLEVKDEDLSDVSDLIITLNNHLPFGALTLLEGNVSLKYVIPISKELKCTNSSTIETFSIFGIFAIQFNESFHKFGKGEITIEELTKTLLP